MIEHFLPELLLVPKDHRRMWTTPTAGLWHEGSLPAHQPMARAVRVSTFAVSCSELLSFMLSRKVDIGQNVLEILPAAHQYAAPTAARADRPRLIGSIRYLAFVGPSASHTRANLSDHINSLRLSASRKLPMQATALPPSCMCVPEPCSACRGRLLEAANDPQVIIRAHNPQM